MIAFRCDCGKPLQAQDEYAGMTTACPACGKELVIPQRGAEPPAVRPTYDPAEDRPARRRRWEDEEDRERPPLTTTSGKATAAFILGLLSFCLPLLLGIPAIILGILGLSDIGKSGGRVGGKGLAITGLVLGCVSMVLMPFVMIALLVPAVQRVREAAARAQDQNNLKQISLALINFADARNGQFPPPVVYSQDGRPLYSWRVLILPFVEEAPLYKQLRLDEPWDSPHNLALAQQMPKLFAHPLDPSAERQGLTHYQLFVGPNPDQGPRPIFVDHQLGLAPAPFVGPNLFMARGAALRFPTGITDGTSNTILVAEAADAVPWTKPADLRYGPNQPLPKLGGLFSGGSNVAMADGSVLFLRDRVSEDTLRHAITANDGMPLGADFP
jgi:prepilin-type processing-associated H-X9-DG protein